MDIIYVHLEDREIYRHIGYIKYENSIILATKSLKCKKQWKTKGQIVHQKNIYNTCSWQKGTFLIYTEFPQIDETKAYHFIKVSNLIL